MPFVTFTVRRGLSAADKSRLSEAMLDAQVAAGYHRADRFHRFLEVDRDDLLVDPALSCCVAQARSDRGCLTRDIGNLPMTRRQKRPFERLYRIRGDRQAVERSWTMRAFFDEILTTRFRNSQIRVSDESGRRRTKCRWSLPVADQHPAARGRKFWAIFLEASQNGKIALIHQLAAEALHIGCASFLFLVCAAMRKGAGRNGNGQQDERQKQFVHCVPSFRQTLR
jgi:hypothetical protein